MKPRRLGAVPLLALLLAGCWGNAADGRRIGGETNWLVTCNSDKDCDSGQCLCNVCTVSCTAGADSCSNGPPDSYCVPASELGSSCAAGLSGTAICMAEKTSTTLTPAPDESPLDQLLEALRRDLLAQPAADRPFLRYVSLANLTYLDNLSPDSAIPEVVHQRSFNRGWRAVTELTNSLSLSPSLALPVTIDEQLQLIRIDLRSYGWERTNSQFRDGWEGAVARATMSVPANKPGGASLAGLSGTTVPWLFVDDFVAAVSNGELYYELLGLPPTLSELRQRWAGAVAYRAGFENSGVSSSPRVVEWRGDPASPGQSYWETMDFQTDARGARIYEDPLGSQPDASEAMFSLPNGLFGFFIADAEGRRVNESPLAPATISDPMQQDLVTRNAVSCLSCHNGGVIPFTDQVRSHWDPLPSGAELAEQQAVFGEYPDAGVLEQLWTAANGRYTRVIQDELGDTEPFDTRNGPPLSTSDSVSLIYREFERDGLNLEQAAKSLLVSPDTLRSRLSELPLLQGLASDGATISRAVFSSVYREALCILHATDQTRIVACPEP